MPIRILPDEIASQIAAGEVVERPASVVKELIENALDAGARQIQIRVEGAGVKKIEVADDGCGIPAEELPLAVARHATSKLRAAEDLFAIRTLGFRGEALASIASVSRMTILSRTAQAAAGARLQVDGGHVGPVEAVGAPVGTLVRVEDLFYNVPARRKFLKKAATERRQIDALVTRYALAYPNVRWQLTQEGRTTLHTSGNGERREVLAALYGPDVARQMLEVTFQEDALRLSGFISPTSLTRSNRQGITFFVNGRPVQDAALIHALLQGYHTLLMVGRYPLAVLFLTLPPDAVDVNVHPAKAEVRFRDRDAVFRAVQRSVRKALLAYTPIPDLAHPVETTWRTPFSPPAEFTAPVGAPEQPTKPSPTEAQAPLPTGRTPLLRLLGQVGATYLVAEGPDGLYLIDQHAAHERVLFEQFMAQRSDHIPSQRLLQPVSVTLSAADAALLEPQLDVLSHLGFEVEPFGPATFRIRAVPTLLAHMDPAAALRVLLEDFEEDETPLQGAAEARIIARVCKRAAVKGGQILSAEEQERLLRDLEACESPRTCPHGRPTMIHLSVDLLERQFGRRGAR